MEKAIYGQLALHYWDHIMGRILEQEGVVLENSLEKKRERERNEENNQLVKGLQTQGPGFNVQDTQR